MSSLTDLLRTLGRAQLVSAPDFWRPDWKTRRLGAGSHLLTCLAVAPLYRVPPCGLSGSMVARFGGQTFWEKAVGSSCELAWGVPQHQFQRITDLSRFSEREHRPLSLEGNVSNHFKGRAHGMNYVAMAIFGKHNRSQAFYGWTQSPYYLRFPLTNFPWTCKEKLEKIN